MRGMVEERFRASIHAVGSVWYSCWVDAGQPSLDGLVPGTEVLTGQDSFPARREGVPGARGH